MKRLTLLCVLVITFSLYALSQDVVIENSSFRSTNRSFIEVERITISDSETAMKMIGYNNPGWWIKVADVTYIEAEGKRYVIKRAEGIELNAEVPTNEKGEIHFTLYFDAIPKNTREITLNENGSIINGIQLLSNYLPRTEVPKKFIDAINIADDGKPLPTPQLIDGKATVKGQIAGYVPEMKIEIEFYVNNPTSGDQEKYTCKVKDDGSFESIIPLVATTSVFTYQRDLINSKLVFSPNEETQIYIDLEQKSCQEARLRNDKCEKGRYIYFAGANAELNNQLFGKEYEAYNLKYKDFNGRLMNDIVGMSAIQYRDYLYAEEKNKLADIENLNVTKKMKEYLSICEKHETFYYLSMGNYFLEKAYKKAKRDEVTGFETPVFDNEYYAFIKDIPFNDPKSLYYTSYSYSVSSVSRLDNVLPVYSHPMTSEILDNLIRQPFYNTKYDAVIDFYRQSSFEKIDPDQLEQYIKRHSVVLNALKNAGKLTGNALVIADRVLALNKIETEEEFETYNNLWGNFEYAAEDIVKDTLLFAQLGVEPLLNIRLHGNELIKGSELSDKFDEFMSNKEIFNYFINNNKLQYLGYKTSIFRDITGIKEGLCYDLLLSQSIQQKFEEMDPLSQFDLDFFSSYFEDPFFIQYLTRKNNDLIAQLEEKKKNPYNVHQTPEVAEDQLLHEILKPHEGKVIFVDFWNTWCGPCRQAMKEFAETKESYKDKNVVFVYLADHSSPETAWNNMISSIGGEHYRLKDEQMQYLRNKFEIKGIPSYVIFNKKGEQVYFRTGFEGANKIAEILDKHLEE